MVGGGGDREGQPPSFSSCPQASSSSSSMRKEDGGRELHPAMPALLAFLASVPPSSLRLSLTMNAHQGVPCLGGSLNQALFSTTVLIPHQEERLGLVW